MFTAVSFAITTTWKQPKHQSVDEWIKKMSHTHIHTHTGIFSHEKGNPAFCNNMDLEGIMLGEIR